MNREAIHSNYKKEFKKIEFRRKYTKKYLRRKFLHLLAEKKKSFREKSKKFKVIFFGLALNGIMYYYVSRK